MLTYNKETLIIYATSMTDDNDDDGGYIYVLQCWGEYGDEPRNLHASTSQTGETTHTA